MFIAQVEMCIAKPEGFSSNSGTDIIPWRDVAGGEGTAVGHPAPDTFKHEQENNSL